LKKFVAGCGVTSFTAEGKCQLGGEATLVRAVFWPMCKAGIKTKGCVDTDGSTSALLAYQLTFDGASILDALIDRYQKETVEAI